MKKGFAIMSGDDRVSPLLALTFSGELLRDKEVDNPGMIAFLEQAEDYYLDKTGDDKPVDFKVNDSPRYRYETTTHHYEMVAGNCMVRWGQWAPYNMYCPKKNGDETATGCVATAVAQLMSVYKHPASYGGYTFNWDEMNSRIYADNVSATAKDGIARLMQQLGLSHNLNTTYGTRIEKGSPANPANIPRTLKNFGFSSGGTLIDYTTEQVVKELQSGYYVLVGGHSYRQRHKKKFLGITVDRYYTHSGGHCWLAHGLLKREETLSKYTYRDVFISKETKVDWYLLCNLGWSGGSDGYYLSAVFDTQKGPAYAWNPTRANFENLESEGTAGNYQYKMTAVVGIRK